MLLAAEDRLRAQARLARDVYELERQRRRPGELIEGEDRERRADRLHEAAPRRSLLLEHFPKLGLFLLLRLRALGECRAAAGVVALQSKHLRQRIVWPGVRRGQADRLAQSGLGARPDRLSASARFPA